VLSQLLHYEQFEQFPISYVAALFKEAAFSPKRLRWSRRQSEIPSPKVVASNSIMVGRGGLQIICHVQNLDGRPTIAPEPHM
jgi:hypothetical protein